MMHATYNPKHSTPGDKPASFDTRQLRYTRDLIGNHLLGAINLPAVKRASYVPRELRSDAASSGRQAARL